MGNTLRSHDNLVHVRGWSSEQIGQIFETLRRKRGVYCLTREEFARYFGGRNREVLTVFSDLDSDCDGRVDIFEVMVLLTIWSGTAWEEKQTLLFDLFDMMGKGFLKLDEVVLMGNVMVQTLRKFVSLEDTQLTDRTALQNLAKEALPPHETTLTRDGFQQWAQGSGVWGRLRVFVENHAARGLEDSKASRMRLRIRTIEQHAARLFERVQLLQDRLPAFAHACLDYVNSWGRRKRWDFLMQNLRLLVLKLQRFSDSMHSELTDMEVSIKEEEESGGWASLLDPQRKFSQEQRIMRLDDMRSESSHDFREATDMLKRLIELTGPAEMHGLLEAEHTGDLHVITEEGDGAVPPKVAESRAMMGQIHAEMLSDAEVGGIFARPNEAEDPLSTAAGPFSATTRTQDLLDGELETTATTRGVGTPGSTVDGAPALVAIADFEPPTTHQAQMLGLVVGDTVAVLGQDGRGWWYGRKQTGKEGWFPPCYVQLKSAHFTSPGEN